MKCQALLSLKNAICCSCDCFRVKYVISWTNWLCHISYWLRSDFLLKLLESPVFPSGSCRPSDQVPSYFSSQVTVGIFCVSFLITLIKSWFMRKINLKHEIWKTKRKYIYISQTMQKSERTPLMFVIPAYKNVKTSTRRVRVCYPCLV